ncbi:RNA-binding protein [Alteromonas sp. 5E99-2]|uniref:RNA recognition motif domain-containing protein n=1 Tax=Alteromonas sp. 5E99-2 TaxID=2817683 RepID=UPI001A9844BA|nr:RNA-binding protein [Alteromonas sp. 5E99-2]MBO1256480.1 RNA-binding protein [Alteromonas sp. 5E99-2]
MKLLIRNLSRSTTQESLLTLFSEFGAVQSCSLVLDKDTGKSKGFGFVEMPKIGDAKVAIAKLNNSEFEGAKLRVKKAQTDE